MRELKFHEKKLLKKVNFFNWRPEEERENQVVRAYRLTRREDYVKYNKICGFITRLVAQLRRLPPQDEFRIQLTTALLAKLHSLGLVDSTNSLLACEKIGPASFCRRRLAVILVRLQFAQTVKEAAQFIEQGHVKVGPNLVLEPALHVTRAMEDLVAWTDTSTIRQKVLKYNDKLDDFDLLEG